MSARGLSRLAASLAVLSLTVFSTACSDDDDDGTGPVDDPEAALVGTWNATSFVGLGQDFVAQGMGVTLTLTSSNTYTLAVANDLIGACDPDPNCSETGTYSATATQFTFDPGTVDSETFNYTIQGPTLTLTGSIDGTPVTIAFTKA
jgi:hypothetical protein